MYNPVDPKEKNDIVVLAIESSCDETACAIVKNGREVLASTIATQIEIPFEVEQAPEPEPAPEPAPEPEVIEEPHEPTTIEKLKAWLNGFMKEVAE